MKIKQNITKLIKYVIINGDEKNLKYTYKSTLKLSMKKSEISFIQIEGVDINNNKIYSGKVWVVVIGDKNSGIARKKYYVTDPSQIKDILLDLIQNGTEQDLIDYLIRFNIPLDLLGLRIKFNIPKPLHSEVMLLASLLNKIQVFINTLVFLKLQSNF